MSAILSADDLNDFISPGVACIKPVETLPKKQEENPYEVTTEDKLEEQNPPPAQISLTDCLACSGCVTSAEAVLVSLQSHAEVLNTLDANPEIRLGGEDAGDGKIFVASVSPQVRASLAATYGISERKAGYMIEQFLSGPHGLRAGGQHGSGFTWVVDTNIMRQVVLELSTAEVTESLAASTSTTQDPENKYTIPNRPILSSSCPGWICYAEKTHPHVLPHLSRLKSPQALTGTFLKTIISKKLNISPSRIWHLAIMPCFDKKLEASRQELTDVSWKGESNSIGEPSSPVRDVDCVITSKELLMLASSRNISLPSLPLEPLPAHLSPFPDQRIAQFLSENSLHSIQPSAAGPSGGYLHHLLTTYQSRHPNSHIQAQRGRNADVVEYTLVSESGDPIIKAARYYGFRNIQNLVRKLKPARASRLPGSRTIAANANGTRARPSPLGNGRAGSGNPRTAQPGTPAPPSEFAYVEVMACPGGCTNGGGQIRIEDAREVNSSLSGEEGVWQGQKSTPQDQRAWLARVDEAYYSDSSEDGVDGNQSTTRGNVSSSDEIHSMLKYWSDLTGVSLEDLVYTTYRKVESDVGKKKGPAGGMDTARVAELAGKAGGGW
ncbi:nuclear prelamin A recognition factor-like protein [Arthroderma uncinatum]|uniref:nuclear prelamin A recognition factor-like protein n=1 Tax=Arthroderma uncinatum TaxID=74035 RepID=UPI00144AD766|nr:nuclear prelamin A recognition factor-like protein [Arthroderma uncinatum]KAF3481443.1 nuclear prelamin A recognition factor-like protein [Arthroderma uncinatum]